MCSSPTTPCYCSLSQASLGQSSSPPLFPSASQSCFCSHPFSWSVHSLHLPISRCQVAVPCPRKHHPHHRPSKLQLQFPSLSAYIVHTMHFNTRLFFTLLTFSLTLFGSNRGSFGMPLPQPKPNPVVNVVKPLPLTSLEEREDHTLALREFMDTVPTLGGSAYNRALLKRNNKDGGATDGGVTEVKPADLSKLLTTTSSGFLFLPIVSSGTPSSSSGSASNGKGDGTPIRQTMFFNIEAPNGGQLTRIDIPSTSPPCPPKPHAGGDKKGGDKTDANANHGGGGGADKENIDKGSGGGGDNGDSVKGQGKEGENKGETSEKAPIVVPAVPAKTPGTTPNNLQDDASPSPKDSKPAASPGPSPGHSVDAQQKTQLTAPDGIDEAKKTRIVFKPLTDPDADPSTVPAPTSPPQPAPTGPDTTNAELTATGAALDADDKKPNPKSPEGGEVGGAGPEATGNKTVDTTSTSTNATTTLGPPAPTTTNTTAVPPPAPSAPNDYFIYPVEQNDKLVDLKKGDMVAYVDKNGDLAGDSSSQAVSKLLGGGGGAGTGGQQPATTPAAPPSVQPAKRSHPRMWDVMQRAPPAQIEKRSPLVFKRDSGER